MNHPRIELKQLERIVELHTEALSYVPMNNPMYGEMSRMLENLEYRVETYHQFTDNPYKTHTSLPKFNSDVELGLGEYESRE